MTQTPARIGLSMLALASLLGILASCSFGLEPLSRSRSTTVRVTLSGPAASPADSRALSSASGFLYAQTGIKPATAKLYGPYPVTAGVTVSIPDIPSGSYPAFILVFVPELPAVPLAPIIPNQATIEGVRLAAQTAIPSDNGLRSSATVGFIADCVINEGEKNTIGATLVPCTDLTPNGDDYIDLPAASGKTARAFIRVKDVKAIFAGTPAEAEKRMIMNVVNRSESDSASITALGFYDSTGTLISRYNEAITIGAGEMSTKTDVWSGDDVYYAYVEYAGAPVSCFFSASVGPVDPPTSQVTVTLNANFDSAEILEPLRATPGAQILIPSLSGKRAGYSFLGWSANDSASTPDYPDGTWYTVGTADVILYAVWQDTGIPSITAISVGSGAAYTTTATTHVEISATETGIGISDITLSGDVGSLSGATVEFDGTAFAGTADGLTFTLDTPRTVTGSVFINGITLSGSDGLKSVACSFTDADGNSSV